MKITLYATPVTKKNHAQLVGGKRPTIRPSQEYLDWLDGQYAEKHLLKQDLGDAIPISGPVEISVHVFRKARTGDLSGFLVAVEDAMQSDVWQCQNPRFQMVDSKKKNKRTGIFITSKSKKSECRKKITSDVPVLLCPHCGCKMKKQRKGLGIILDDSQIVRHVNNVLDIDKTHPRIEVEIRKVVAAQPSLFDESQDNADIEQDDDDDTIDE